ncbi:MAG: YdcF family protein, partial [Bacillota bacterium]|nr:YdcF family protein [Bacillota bacterium]
MTLFIILSLVLLVVIINASVILTAKSFLISEEEALKSPHHQTYDAIVILGAGIRNGRPSPLLAERLDTGITLYQNGFSDKIILSGDSLDLPRYDEVSVMRNYLLEQGIPSSAMIRDDLGLNTHRTVYRALHVFGLKRYILVSQNYHLERAVFLARCFGSETIGISCDKTAFSGQMYRDLREIPARVKDFFIGL